MLKLNSFLSQVRKHDTSITTVFIYFFFAQVLQRELEKSEADLTKLSLSNDRATILQYYSTKPPGNDSKLKSDESAGISDIDSKLKTNENFSNSTRRKAPQGDVENACRMICVNNFFPQDSVEVATDSATESESTDSDGFYDYQLLSGDKLEPNFDPQHFDDFQLEKENPEPNVAPQESSNLVKDNLEPSEVLQESSDHELLKHLPKPNVGSLDDFYDYELLKHNLDTVLLDTSQLASDAIASMDSALDATTDDYSPETVYLDKGTQVSLSALISGKNI